MENISAALLIIGDEILSGRTQDKNINYIARYLEEIGICLQEVRIVADQKTAIIEAINVLRNRFTYLFTTGGIGPTHDDITAECIAKAFDVPLEIHAEAFDILQTYYGAESFTKARQRMARIPKGGILIKNPISKAPGFQVDNVFTMAGVPNIMQTMLDDVRPRLQGGDKVKSRSIRLDIGESIIAEPLSELQRRFPEVSIGSYPAYAEGKNSLEIVMRSTNSTALENCTEQLKSYVKAKIKA